MGDETRPIVITPLVATLLAAFVTLVVSGAGFIIAELRATNEKTEQARQRVLTQVEQVRQEAKVERDRYRDEILKSIGAVQDAAKELSSRMFSKSEHAIYDRALIERQATLQAKIDALESSLIRHLDNTAIQSFVEQ